MNTSELNWQAFRYVAGEMSSGEREAFERSLSDDVERCEAVARAVRVCAAVRAAEADGDLSSPVRAGTRGRNRRPRIASWVAVATVAGCLFLLFELGLPKQDAIQPGGEDTVQNADDRLAEQLVAYWNRSTTAVSVESGSGAPEYEYDPSSVAAVTGAADESFGWMLAAVSDDHEQDSADDKMWEN